MYAESYPIILYGAGDNGKSVLSLLRGRGIEPAAFCSRDANRSGEICCGLPVMSREEVKAKFGNQFRIWITPYSPTREEIERELLNIGFVEESMILNLSEKKTGEEYLSCYVLRNAAVIMQDMLQTCCSSAEDFRYNPPGITFDPPCYEGDVANLEFYRSVVRDFMRLKASLIENLRTGKSCVCDGCPSLKKARWSDYNGKITDLGIGVEYPCQLSCAYCDIKSNAKYKDKDHIRKTKKINVPMMVRAMEMEGVLEPSFPVVISAGEISIAQQKQAILNDLSKFPLLICTNAVLFDEQIAALTSRDDSSAINISLDAGTAETYRKVKGLDSYEKVLENIRRYRKRGCRVDLKYILVSGNCGKADIDGFITFCEEVGAHNVQISRDLFVKISEIPQEVLNGAIYMVKRAKERHLRYSLVSLWGEKNIQDILNQGNG